jgi:transcription elongation factor GreA
MDQKEKIEYILANDIIKLLEINEEKMMNISEIIQRSEIAEKDSNPTNVKIGSVVDLEFGDKTLKYTLVSTLEADPSANKISEKSPLGQALLGKQKSEIVKLITPKGLALRYKLLSIT